jgi:recombination endonuclease VII
LDGRRKPASLEKRAKIRETLRNTRALARERLTEETEKYCKYCSTVQPIDCLGKYKDCKSGWERWRNKCKSCSRNASNERYSSNPDVRSRMKATAQAGRFKNLYGVSVQEVDDMRAAQSFKCGACGLTRPLCVDHDHVTGRVRGLLCKQCNFGIGYFHDSVSKLEGAIEYLKKAA